MNSDIRISVSFRGHRKRKKLSLKLGEECAGYLLDLWLSVTMDRPDGTLAGLDNIDIALMAEWEKDSDEFVAALVETGFIDGTELSYVIHGWAERNGYASDAEARSEQARKASKARWDKRLNRDIPINNNAQVMHEQCISNTENMQMDNLSNAPSPYPSLYPSLKKEKETPRKKPRGTSPDHTWVTRWWCFAFNRHTGCRFVYQKKHAGIVAGLLKTLGLEELISRSCFYLCIPDEQRFPRGSPTLEGLVVGINQFAGKCDSVIEDKCFKLGILPDEGVTLENFTPWAAGKVHPLPTQPGLNPGHSP